MADASAAQSDEAMARGAGGVNGASVVERGSAEGNARMRSGLVQALVVVGVCVLVYWGGLGRFGLRSTEGHRAIPGWTALAEGAWLPTRMFEAVYMRKPPGMAWAIAGSSAALGETEFAARAPSALGATAMALMALVFTRRWFGARWGLYGGLAQALMPSAWPPGRSAEIETLNNMFCALAVWCLIDAVVFARSLSVGGILSSRIGGGLEAEPALSESRWRALAMAALGGVGVIGTALMKGPGALACCLGAAGACAVVVGWRRAARDVALWVWALVGAAGVGALMVVLARATLREPGFEAGVSDKLIFYHLWRRDELMEYAALAPLTFAMTLPAGLGLLLPWGGDARREIVDTGYMDEGPALGRSYGVARALAWGFALSLGVFMLAGVANARYTMPVGVFAPALAAYGARGAAGAFGAKRAGIARMMLLGNAKAWVIALLGAALWWAGVREPARGADSGRAPGVALGERLPDGAEVWAHWMVEARPETLWYAQRAAAEAGKRVRVRWMPHELEGLRGAPRGVYLFLDDTREGGEADRWREEFGSALEEIAHARVHEARGALLRVK